MKIVAIIGWIVIGFLQLSAMRYGFTDILGSFFGFIASMFLGQIPIIGTILGIRGAVVNWDWSILQAIGLFVGAPISLIGINALTFGDKSK